MPRPSASAPPSSGSDERARPAPARRPTMTPYEAKLFEALGRTPGRPVSCVALAELLYGDARPDSLANTTRMVANLKIALKVDGTMTIVSHGWRADLAYALAPVEPVQAAAPSKAMPARRGGEAPGPAPAQLSTARPRLPAGSVTLPPCGYAAWTYRENGDHAVRLKGEDRTRVLTPADQRFRSLTTERGEFEQADPANGEV